jgi:hypothetical protein
MLTAMIPPSGVLSAGSVRSAVDQNVVQVVAVGALVGPRNP